MRSGARRRKRLPMRGFAIAACLLCACSDSEGDRSADVSVTDVGLEVRAEVTADVVSDLTEVVEPVDYPALDVVWTPCDELAGEPHARVDCAEVVAPLDWEHPDGETITLFVKRVRSAAWDTDPGAPRRALWLLMGGPGQAGAGGEGTVVALAQRDPGLDLYLPDHRGTGRSTRLTCPLQEGPLSHGGEAIVESEWPVCRDVLLAKWGERLAFFSTTQAAHDTAALIAAVHAPEDQVVVIGISYGTYLTNRYLQVAPQHSGGLADAVVLDSIAAPGACRLSGSDVWEDAVARQILAHCPDDPACAARFSGPSGVWDALGDLYDDIAAGHCPITGEPEQDIELLKTALGNLAFSFAGRRAMPALIHRYQRCDEADVHVIRSVYERTFGYDPGAAAPGPLTGFSWTLSTNIVVSEMWEPSDPSPDELVERWQATRSCRGVSKQLAWQIPGWPRYVEPLRDAFADFAALGIPVLAMNGDLDPATPAEQARTIEPHLVAAAHQRYLEIPGAAHGVIAQGQLLSDATTTCGRELLLQFVRDPEAELDTGCLADTKPLGFFMRDEAVEYYFGTPDMWGD